jgi:hypothetical protein
MTAFRYHPLPVLDSLQFRVYRTVRRCRNRRVAVVSPCVAFRHHCYKFQGVYVQMLFLLQIPTVSRRYLQPVVIVVH